MKLSNPVTTVRLYSVSLPKPIDIKKFALSNKNCKVDFNNIWRCTYTDDDFKLNIYGWGNFILFTKIMDVNDIEQAMERLFNQKPKKITLRNWAIKVNFYKRVNLDNLKEELSNNHLYEVFTRKKTKKEIVQLDKQSFTAVILRPFIDTSKITFSIFATGSIGVTGLKNLSDVSKVQDYLHSVLIHKLELHASTGEETSFTMNTGDVDDLFTF